MKRSPMFCLKNLLLAFGILLAFAAPLANAAEGGAEGLLDFTYGLNARVVMENTALNTSPQVILVRVIAENPSETGMPLYLMKQDENGWSGPKLLGTLPGGKTGEMNIEIVVEYEKETKKKTRYLVAGRADGGEIYGKFFELSEDWSGYERQINDSISLALLLAIPAIGSLLVALIYIIAKTAYSRKGEGEGAEYTMGTLVVPQTEGRPFWEKLADVMIHPGMIIVELFWVAVFIVLIIDGVSAKMGFDSGLHVVALSGLCAFLVPFLYFFAAWYFSKREEGKPLRFFAGMFSWGMFVAFFSLLLSSAIAGAFLEVDILPFAIIVTLLVSPIVEESLKGFGVLVVAGHHEYNDMLTGMLLGFTCGAGFAFVENWFYFASKANPFDMGLSGWVMLVVYRSFFNTLAHGCFTASLGAMIGYAKNVAKLRRFAALAFIPGLAIAIGIHMVFNLSAIADSFMVESRQLLFFVFNPMLIILLAALFFIVLMLAILDEKHRKLRLGEAFRSENLMSGGKEGGDA